MASLAVGAGSARRGDRRTDDMWVSSRCGDPPVADRTAMADAGAAELLVGLTGSVAACDDKAVALPDAENGLFCCEAGNMPADEALDDSANDLVGCLASRFSRGGSRPPELWSVARRADRVKRFFSGGESDAARGSVSKADAAVVVVWLFEDEFDSLYHQRTEKNNTRAHQLGTISQW